MTNWKSPTEELPNDNELVVIITKEDDILLVNYFEGRTYPWDFACGFESDTFGNDEIKAWCRIPNYDLEGGKE